MGVVVGHNNGDRCSELVVVSSRRFAQFQCQCSFARSVVGSASDGALKVDLVVASGDGRGGVGGDMSPTI
ncbi:Hypothetical predicted protein [Olea europaea subsp. europaea]|uniref:Uncharacterized protein n=1 Tax=Olea europaea subsp. europaea TaxID=158383 RepID=A0A8S0U158_OLEEU|nr:Hypothetical predicted protein [Olea europaea subsp. europaea]